MYYEERIIGGVLCYRTTPNGRFKQMSAEMLTVRVQELMLLLNIKKTTP